MIFIDYQNDECRTEYERLIAEKEKFIYFKYLDWDSAFFGRPSFVLDMSRSNFEPSDELTKEIEKNFVGSFITAKVDTKYDYGIVFFLQKSGFYYVDTEIVLKLGESEFVECKNSDIRIEEMSMNIGLPYNELGSVFKLTRFHTDINIQDGKANDLWVNYLKNYEIDSNHRMFVALSDGILCGVILVNSSKVKSTVFFVSVINDYRGKNIGSAMIQYVIEKLKNINIYTETQVKNILALNFYIKNGFKKINKTMTVLHRWSND